MNTIMRIRLAVMALVVFMTADALAIGTHFVENFTPDVIGSGGQIWDVAAYDDNWVYFANKDGVLQYDGNSWRTFSLNNGHDARAVCVCPDEGRVYVSGINEFGYLEPDDAGIMHYRCLSDTLGEKKYIGNMWGIVRSDDEIVIQGDYNVMRYKPSDGRMAVVASDVKLDCSVSVDDVLYIGTESGLKMMVGNSLIAAPGASSLVGKRIRGVIPYRNGVMVATAYSGLWFYADGRLEAFVTGCDEMIRSTELFTAAIAGDILAVGTIQNGVIVVNLDDGSYQVYNYENGLQNNTVLSLRFDGSGNLWVGMDYGISRIQLDKRTATLFSGHTSIGRGYAVAIHDGKLYVGTNRGLYMADYPYSADRLRNVDGVSGQVWDLKEHDGRLFCMHDRGLFEITGTHSRRIGQNIGTWSIRPRQGAESGFWAGTYTGLCAMTNGATGLSLAGTVSPDYSSFYAFVEDSSGRLWVYDDVRGMVRMDIDQRTFEVDALRYYGFGQAFPETSQAAVAEIDGTVYFATDSGVYRYDADQDAIKAASGLNALLSCDRNGCLWLEQRGDHLFAMTKRELLRLCVHPDTVVDRIALRSVGDKPMKISDRLYFLDDSTVVVPGYDGMTIYNFAHHSDMGHGVPPVARINGLRLSASADSVLYSSNFMNRRNSIVLPYHDNSIIITYGVMDPERYGVTAYRYRLSGRPWSEPALSMAKEYTDLHEGDYRFEVEALMADGAVVSDFIEFSVLPPWYRSVAAMIVYGMMVIVAIVAAYMLYRKRMRRIAQAITAEGEQRLLSQQTAFEHEIRQKDSEIEEIRRQKIESELEHKSQEVVNLLLMLSRNRETLLDLKEELFKLTHAVGANPEAKKLINQLQGKINSNMQSDNIMERVEKEFDILNDDMIKKLRRSYPTLSSNEMLMCAYLRMNLSSKEIAPLLNISLRGVETMRYRLRKKFGLDRDVSITDFIMGL